MLRTEMVYNLLDSYTRKELESLAIKLGIDHLNETLFPANIRGNVGDVLFDPGGWHKEFNKLNAWNKDAEMEG